MKKLVAAATLVAMTLFYASPGFTQQASEDLRKELEALKEGQVRIQRDLELRKELEAVKEGQRAIQRELQGIKDLLQARPASPAAQPQAATPGQPQAVAVSVDGDPFVGDKSAKVTIIEFLDYQCPFCARHFRETLPQIQQEYIKTGKVKYVVREFPLESIHPQAFKASEAALCAGEQKKYFEMHDRLFSDQKALGVKDLPKHAEVLGLDVPKFQQCVESGKYAAKVRKDVADGQRAGVSGTPSFFLGLTEPNSSEVKPVRSLKGAQPYPAFQAAIDDLLSSRQ